MWALVSIVICPSLALEHPPTPHTHTHTQTPTLDAGQPRPFVRPIRLSLAGSLSKATGERADGRVAPSPRKEALLYGRK